MATQSGIQAAPELQEQWAQALANPETRLIKIVIKDEQLTLASSLSSPTSSSLSPQDSFNKDFDLFNQEGVVEDKVPAYYLYRLTPPPTSTFLLLLFVPDASPIRLKLLYASTTASLLRTLGGSSRVPSTLHCTLPSELTLANWEAQGRHEGAERPRTEREREVEEIKRQERREQEEGGGEGEGRRSHLYGGGGEGGEGEGGEDGKLKGVLPWSEEAKEAVRKLGGEEGSVGDVAQLEIDIATETVVLSPSQPSSLSVPPSSPCYFFYRHPAGVVLIYSCPPSSPVKSRLIYSSAALVLYKVAAPHFAGVTVIKKLETDTPAEVTPSWIDEELGPSFAVSGGGGAEGAGSTPGSGTATPVFNEEEKPKFARPVRPGRKR